MGASACWSCTATGKGWLFQRSLPDHVMLNDWTWRTAEFVLQPLSYRFSYTDGKKFSLIPHVLLKRPWCWMWPGSCYVWWEEPMADFAWCWAHWQEQDRLASLPFCLFLQEALSAGCHQNTANTTFTAAQSPASTYLMYWQTCQLFLTGT